MVTEIMHALQQHEPLCCKLHNHKADGRKFQNLLCLHPIFGSEGEYLYQVCAGYIIFRPGIASRFVQERRARVPNVPPVLFYAPASHVARFHSDLLAVFMREKVGMQVELHAHPGMTAQIIEMERVLRLLPSSICGDNNDVRITSRWRRVIQSH